MTDVNSLEAIRSRMEFFFKKYEESEQEAMKWLDQYGMECKALREALERDFGVKE